MCIRDRTITKKLKPKEYEPQTETRKDIDTDITPQTKLNKRTKWHDLKDQYDDWNKQVKEKTPKMKQPKDFEKLSPMKKATVKEKDTFTAADKKAAKKVKKDREATTYTDSDGITYKRNPKNKPNSPLKAKDGTTVSKDGKKVTKRRTLSKEEATMNNVRSILGFDNKSDRTIAGKSGSGEEVVRYTTKDVKRLPNETDEQFKNRKKMIKQNIARQSQKTIEGGGPMDIDQIKGFEDATKTAHAVQYFANKRKKK